MVREDEVAKGWCPEDDGKKCPVCGFEYIHLKEVGCLLGNDRFAEKIRGTKIRGTVKYRESALVLAYFCENGHFWEETVQPCKGNMLHTWKEIVPGTPQGLGSLWELQFAEKEEGMTDE